MATISKNGNPLKWFERNIFIAALVISSVIHFPFLYPQATWILQFFLLILWTGVFYGTFWVIISVFRRFGIK